MGLFFVSAPALQIPSLPSVNSLCSVWLAIGFHEAQDFKPVSVRKDLCLQSFCVRARIPDRGHKYGMTASNLFHFQQSTVLRRVILLVRAELFYHCLPSETVRRAA